MNIFQDIINNKKIVKNHIWTMAESIFDFIKKFVKDIKKTFAKILLSKFFQRMGRIYKLLIEIMNLVSGLSENAVERIKKIFIEKSLTENWKKMMKKKTRKKMR